VCPEHGGKDCDGASYPSTSEAISDIIDFDGMQDLPPAKKMEQPAAQ
jgi:hypothetical protein